MSLARYRYFEKVARLGSIRRAAEVLHVAPSAISRQIGLLEDEFGTELLERGTRGVRLTSSGEVLLRQACNILDAHNQARSSIDDLGKLRRGHVCVWSMEGMVKDFVAPVLAEFQSEFPGVTAELIIASSDRVDEALLRDDADIGISFNAPVAQGVTAKAEIADPLFVVMHPDHDNAKKSKLSLHDLVDWPIALAEKSFGIRHAVDAVAAALNLDLRPALVTNSIEALREFARLGTGVTILTKLWVKQDLEMQRLAAVPFREQELRETGVKICIRQNRRLPIATSELLRRFAKASQNAFTPVGGGK